MKVDSVFRVGLEGKPGRCGMGCNYCAFGYGYYYDDDDDDEVRCMMLQLQHYHYYHVP